MKQLLIPMFLSSLLMADCSLEEENRAMKIWQKSIHKNETSKLKLLNQALAICQDLDVAYVDKLLIDAKKNPNKEILMELKNRTNNLALPPQFHQHKWNIGQQLNQLFLNDFRKQKKALSKEKGFGSGKLTFIEKQIKELTSNPISGVKAVTVIGGTYQADLLFDQGKYAIKNTTLAQEIIDVIHEVVEENTDAIFGLEGGASSEGSSKNNKILSKHRGEALAKKILKKYPSYKENIKVFAMGESQLVCEKGLLPEKNTKGEYECITKENRKKSRKVTIRRIK